MLKFSNTIIEIFLAWKQSENTMNGNDLWPMFGLQTCMWIRSIKYEWKMQHNQFSNSNSAPAGRLIQFMLILAKDLIWNCICNNFYDIFMNKKKRSDDIIIKISTSCYNYITVTWFSCSIIKKYIKSIAFAFLLFVTHDIMLLPPFFFMLTMTKPQSFTLLLTHITQIFEFLINQNFSLLPLCNFRTMLPHPHPFWVFDFRLVSSITVRYCKTSVGNQKSGKKECREKIF